MERLLTWPNGGWRYGSQFTLANGTVVDDEAEGDAPLLGSSG